MAIINYSGKTQDQKKNLGNKSVWVKRIEREVLPILPVNLRQLIAKVPKDMLVDLEEIRLRKDRYLSLKFMYRDCSLDANGSISNCFSKGYRITEADINNCLQLISNCSVYALEEEFKRGFVTVKGGHRIGLVGKVILEKGEIKTQRTFSSINIRIAREVKGVARKVMPYLINNKTGRLEHIVIVSPPGCGKTTLLRDIIRLVSNGIPELNFPGVNVGVVDERSEIAACYEGVPQNEVGLRTDVIDGCPKAEGMIILVRSMNPRVIVTDEIGSAVDVEAIKEVLNSGVTLITTVHGASAKELLHRPALRELVESKIINKYIVLGKSRGVGTIEAIYEDIAGENLLKKPIAGAGED